ncbi:MAG: exodeoxyribonuclease VII small subunit [Hornefia sp.]|nr:exodeoxyribonuclease VII small subunit [Hornefia sp.]
MNEKMSFEEALKKLNKLAEKIKSSNTNLEESIAYYEEGMKYYNICNEILSQANQKIETFDAD